MTMHDEREVTNAAGEPAGTRQGTTYDEGSEAAAEPSRATTPADRPDGPRAGGRAEPADAEVRERGAVPPSRAGTPSPGEERFDIFGSQELTALRDRWGGLQATFVDDPAGAARQADGLLGEILAQLQRRHQELRDEFSRSGDGRADTEAQRVAFLRYRSFFRTLLG